MSNPIRPKRKFAPKGRSGCHTCKLRHVKCDEQKPRCTPCQKSSRQCEYSADSVRPALDQLKVVMWQPNGLNLRRLSPDSCQNSEEGRAFQFFRNQVAVGLGGFFDSSFWSRMVLQAAQQEPSVRHAVVALASLSESLFQKDTGAEGQPNAWTLNQYTKAISEVNRKLHSNSRPATEVVLITCLVFICFEMLQNHHESALSQISSGIRVYCDWHSQFQPDVQGRSELHVQLTLIFGRLMLQSLLFLDTHLFDQRVLTPAFTPIMPSIPPVFTSINEARDCLNSFLSCMTHAGLAPHFIGSRNEELFSSTARPLFQLAVSPFHAWSHAFEAFMATSSPKMSAREQKAATLLEMQQVTGFILASAGAFPQETVFDAFEDSFSEIVTLASRFISASGDAETSCPTFDMGAIPPVYFVASRCRHPLIRRQALHLLRHGPPQEGIWNSGMLANLAERIIGMEEESCLGVSHTEDVLGIARLFVLNATIHSAQRRVAVDLCRQRLDDYGNFEVLHEWVEY